MGKLLAFRCWRGWEVRWASGGELGGSHQAEAALRVPSVAAVQALAGPQAACPAGSHTQTVQNLTQQIQFFSRPQEAAVQSFLCPRILGILRAQSRCPG